PALAELLVQRFLDADPLRIDGSAITLPARIAAICATAPPAASARCFARVRALRGRLSGGTTEETDALLRGAERYAAREFDAAAAAWRPLLGGSAPLAAMLPDAMAEVFDATDNAEIAERVDQAVMQRGAEFGGATMGHVRAARRALLRGDRARARSLANQVVVAWQFADQAPPALTEMQHLVRRLDERPPR
ncbi:MAG TPA: hypothetical protein VIX73_37480, partial [Kofleriaceae bacterium]